MSLPTLSQKQHWHPFWSTWNGDMRVRHQVRWSLEKQVWMVRTQFTQGLTSTYSTYIEVPPGHAQHFRAMVHTWTNINDENNPAYPPGYEAGFRNLKDEVSIVE